MSIVLCHDKESILISFMRVCVLIPVSSSLLDAEEIISFFQTLSVQGLG